MKHNVRMTVHALRKQYVEVTNEGTAHTPPQMPIAVYVGDLDVGVLRAIHYEFIYANVKLRTPELQRELLSGLMRDLQRELDRVK